MTNLTIKEFFELEDIELQKYAFLNGKVDRPYYFKKVDSEARIAYLQVSEELKCQRGAFYKKDNVHQWIVYNKQTKKVKLSKTNAEVRREMLKEKFNFVDIVDLVIGERLTPTICKKIIEDKINTVEDIIKYHRSYTIRNKNADLNVVYKYSFFRKLYLYNHLINPEDLNMENHTLMDLPTPWDIMSGCVFKFKLEEMRDLTTKMHEWNTVQGKRFAEVQRSRDGDVSNQPSKKSPRERARRRVGLPF